MIFINLIKSYKIVIFRNIESRTRRKIRNIIKSTPCKGRLKDPAAYLHDDLCAVLP